MGLKSWMRLVCGVLVVLPACGGLAAGRGGTADSAESVVLPSGALASIPDGPNLILDGGFEGIGLDAKDGFGWRCLSRAYSADVAKANSVAQRLTAGRTAEVRTSGAFTGRSYAYLKNPEAADEWRGGAAGPDITTYLSRYVIPPKVERPSRAVVLVRYRAALSEKAAGSKVRIGLLCFDDDKRPWGGKYTREAVFANFGESPDWSLARLEAVVPAGTRAVQVALYLDGCGEVQFDDVQFHLGESDRGLEMRLHPMFWLGNEFHVRGALDFITFAVRNAAGVPVQKPIAVVELPDFLTLECPRLGVAEVRNGTVHGSKQYRISLALFRGILTARSEGYLTYNAINCILGSKSASVGGVSEGRYWIEDGSYQSGSRSFTLRTVARTVVAARPKLFRSGAVVSREMDLDEREKDAKGMAATMVRAYAAAGFNAIHISGAPKLLLQELEGIGIHRSFEAPWIVNGYQLGGVRKPESARMVKPDGTYHPNGICPQEVIERGVFFREGVEGLLRQVVAADRLAEDVMPNWEPYLFKGQGCFCERCRREFWRHSGGTGADFEKAWPKETMAKYPEEWRRFRAWQHGRVVTQLEKSARAIGREAGKESHFVPSISIDSLLEGVYKEKHFADIDPYQYATELPWLQPWGLYVYTRFLTPLPRQMGEQLLPYLAQRKVSELIEKRIPDERRRPRMIAYPHALQGEDMVTTPEAMAMGLLSTFVNRWQGAYLYNFPRGYDARYWNAAAGANEIIGQHEEVVLTGRVTDSQAVKIQEPIPSRGGFTSAQKAGLKLTYSEAIDAPLIQVRGFEAGRKRVIAIGNFWEQQAVRARLSVAGLVQSPRFVVRESHWGASGLVTNTIKKSGAELADGIPLSVPALRWMFIRIEPAEEN